MTMNLHLDLCSSSSTNSESGPTRSIPPLYQGSRAIPIRTRSSTNLPSHLPRPPSQSLSRTKTLSPKRISRFFSTSPKNQECYEQLIKKINLLEPLQESLSPRDFSWNQFVSYLFKQHSNRGYDIFAKLLERSDISPKVKEIFINEFLREIDIDKLDAFFRLKGNRFIKFHEGDGLRVHTGLLARYIPYFESINDKDRGEIKLHYGNRALFYTLINDLIFDAAIPLFSKQALFSTIALCDELGLTEKAQDLIERVTDSHQPVEFFDSLPSPSIPIFFAILLKYRNVPLDFTHEGLARLAACKDIPLDVTYALLATLVERKDVPFDFKHPWVQKFLGGGKSQLNAFFAQQGNLHIHFSKKTIKVHKGLLALYIPYFASLEEDKLELKKIKIKPLNLLISCVLFEKEIKIRKKNLYSLLVLSDSWGLHELIQKYQDWADANLTLKEKAKILSELKPIQGYLDDFKLHLILTMGADIKNLKKLDLALKDIRKYTLPLDIPLDKQMHIIETCDEVEELCIHASQLQPLEFISKNIRFYNNLKQLIIRFDSSTPDLNPSCLIQFDSNGRVDITLDALLIDTNFLKLLPQMSLIKACILKQCILQEKILSLFPVTMEQLSLINCFKEDGKTGLDEIEIQILPSRLEVLELSKVILGVKSFQRIQHLPLKFISLNECSFSGSFQDVKPMKLLSRLELNSCRMTSEAYMSLKSLEELVEDHSTEII